MLNATRAYLPPAQARRQLEQLGWHLLVSYVVRNADCHAKNIALYYTCLADVGYTPVYDIVTTQAYPRYASNPTRPAARWPSDLDARQVAGTLLQCASGHHTTALFRNGRAPV